MRSVAWRIETPARDILAGESTECAVEWRGEVVERRRRNESLCYGEEVINKWLSNVGSARLKRWG